MKTYTLDEIKELWLLYKLPVMIVESGVFPLDLEVFKINPGQIIEVSDIDKIKTMAYFENMSFPDFLEYLEYVEKEEQTRKIEVK